MVGIRARISVCYISALEKPFFGLPTRWPVRFGPVRFGPVLFWASAFLVAQKLVNACLCAGLLIDRFDNYRASQ
jgi:hypothetical protein